MATVAQRLEIVHVGFLRQVTKSKAKWLSYSEYQKAMTNKVLQVVETQPLQTYLDRRQATVAEWMDLRHIFDVCARG